jgi:hypothetical protein
MSTLNDRAARAGSAEASPALPFGRTLRIGANRISYEVRAYFRQGDSVFLTFLFPLVMLTIFSVAFSEGSFGLDADGNDVSAADFYLPAMLAAGLLLSGLQNMAIDQEAGWHTTTSGELFHRQDWAGFCDGRFAGCHLDSGGCNRVPGVATH